MDWGEYESVRVALSALDRAGPLDPAVLGPALRPALKSGLWRDWVHPVTGERHFDNFDAFVEHETQHRVDVILVALRPDRRCADVVAAIEATRRDQIAALDINGRHSSSRNTKGDTGGYVIARLKRDDPALAAEVIDGSISPHAAALQAGIRRPRATFVTDDVDQAVAALLRRYSAEDVLAALKRAD
jgi:hypothetical protein